MHPRTGMSASAILMTLAKPVANSTICSAVLVFVFGFVMLS
jgi:hypothetical protein